jgi:choline dehydrogenase-like flavoprotein
MATLAELPTDIDALIPERSLAYPNVECGWNARRDLTLTADVIVVGTGAGGAVAAALMAEAGLDVLMLEEGVLHTTKSFSTDVLATLRALYRDAGTSAIGGRPGIIFAEGRCVGGSTVINGGMCWRTPERILARWEREERLPEIGPAAMEPFFEEVEREVNPEVNREDTLGRHNLLFAEGARKLGWNPKPNLRNMRRCAGLNNCAFGCPTGAKQSMLVTYVPRALRAGARLATAARVDRVLFHGERATGVSGYFVGENLRATYRFSAHAPLVVLAAGARHTIGILKRSRLRARMIGRNLKTHPNAKVVGIFDEEINAWRGTHQSHQIHDFLDANILLAYAMIPPGLLAASLPGLGGKSAELMALYNHMLPAVCLIEDSGSGRVTLGWDRQPVMSYSLNRADTLAIHEGVAKAAQLMFAAGARRVLLPFAEMTELSSPDELHRVRQRPPRPAGIELMTVHIMGSARMAAEPGRGAVDPFGRVFATRGLYVADASLFPSGVGVNPQETIMALVTRNARRWLESDVRSLLWGRRKSLTAGESS